MIAVRPAPSISPRNRAVRCGAVLIVALICLTLTAVVFASLLRSSMARAQMLRQDVRAQQAHWLAEAGIERAAAMMAHDPDYTGEVWHVPAAELPSHHDAVVTIEVKPHRDGQQSILVIADYPAQEHLRVRSRKQITYRHETPTPGTPENVE